MTTITDDQIIEKYKYHIGIALKDGSTPHGVTEFARELIAMAQQPVASSLPAGYVFEGFFAGMLASQQPRDELDAAISDNLWDLYD